jgi:hypothetical protein
MRQRWGEGLMEPIEIIFNGTLAVAALSIVGGLCGLIWMRNR